MPPQMRAPHPPVLVAHPSPDTVDVLKALLEHEGFPVLTAYDGHIALQHIQRHHPGIALLGERLPLLDAMELCRTVRREVDSPPIFILGDQPDELAKLLAFSAGADDYLTVPVHPRELLARVSVALRRMSTREPAGTIIRRGSIQLDPERHEVRAGQRVVDLTSLEYELLSLLLLHPGRVFTREELLARLRRYLRGDSLERTIDIHVSNLRHKLGHDSGAAALIETVRGAGYRLRAQPGVPRDAAATAAPEPELTQVAMEALRHAPVPMLLLRADRTVALCNEAARQLCGDPPETIEGRMKCFSLLLCHRPDGTLLCHGSCVLHEELANPPVEQVSRYAITRSDGQEVLVDACYHPLRTTATAQAYVLLTLQPIPAAGGNDDTN